MSRFDYDLGSDSGGQWRALGAGYPAEAALHDLVQRAPQMLLLAGSPRLTVLGQEVRLGSGFADLLAVESTGRLAPGESVLAAAQADDQQHGTDPEAFGDGLAASLAEGGFRW